MRQDQCPDQSRIRSGDERGPDQHEMRRSGRDKAPIGGPGSRPIDTDRGVSSGRSELRDRGSADTGRDVRGRWCKLRDRGSADTDRDVSSGRSELKNRGSAGMNKEVSGRQSELNDRGSADRDRDVSGRRSELKDHSSAGTDKDVSRRCSELRDRGSATLWMLALIGLIWSVATMAMAVGGARAARHRAYAAADLAALAAASHFAEGAGSACELAARIARGSGGRLRQCVFHGRISDVVVVSEIQGIPALGRLTATARARAGPEPAPGPCDPPLPCPARQPPP
jgi:secretion/DNA translocation related TadE-like protein